MISDPPTGRVWRFPTYRGVVDDGSIEGLVRAELRRCFEEEQQERKARFRESRRGVAFLRDLAAARAREQARASAPQRAEREHAAMQQHVGPTAQAVAPALAIQTK
eukprot:TRINITY_DN13923_c1_g1_i1.p2 TRINITY_DN13923_c1_g1~~TRINITY_DN13923_c1_g1_i1.p2  ORF type:complete len:106 (+),score=15.42 TRINITY_DN13923_c1_g1_i1:115-432(+)